MFGRGLATVALLVSKAAATILYARVAESGGEFGTWSKFENCDSWRSIAYEEQKGATADPHAGLPGTFGQEYAFISKPGIDVYVDQNKVSST